MSNTEPLILNAFNGLARKAINQKIQTDPIQFIRSKTLLALLLFFCLILTAYSSFFIWNGVLFNVKALLNYLGLLLVLLCIFLLKVSPSIKNIFRVINYSGILLTTGGVYWSGGFESNDILWYLVVALSALLFIGKVDGIIVTLISMLAIIGFYLVDALQLAELQPNPLTQSIHYRFANTMIIIVILFSLVWILVRSNQGLQKIIQKIEASQIRESISKDFHDELGNKLVSIIHLSKRLKKNERDHQELEMLESIEKESKQVYESFREFIWLNDRNSLTVNSLHVYLTDFCQHFFSHQATMVEGTVTPENHKGDSEIPSTVVRNIILIFKELMTNIHKHAEAKTVRWSLIYDKDQLQLEVIDNGMGFDQASVSVGQGIKSIQKRAQELHTTLELTSEQGKGTKAKIKISIAS